MGGKGVGKRMWLFFFFWLHRVFVAACGILYPKQGSNPGPLRWEHRVLATGPPEKFRRLWLFEEGESRQDLVTD